MARNGSRITTGNVSGTGIAIGDHAQATVTFNQQKQDEVLNLLQQLRAEIQKSAISEGAKNVLLTKAVPEMQKAVTSNDPKSGLERGLERVNNQLEGVDNAAKHVGGIVDTVAKIAQTVGIGIKIVAPFLASLL